VNWFSICVFLFVGSTAAFAQDQSRDIASPASGPGVVTLDAGYRAPASTEGSSLLYSNGPLINNPGGGAGGADESVLQSESLGMTIIGFGHQLSLNNHVADDFTITDDSWMVDSLVFWAYQLNSGNISTINDLRYQIWNAPPDSAGSTVILGDLTTNRLIATTWDDLYRVIERLPMNTARPIMRNTVSGGFTLPQGNYWIEWTTGGTLSSGPWAPPITINGMTTTGNAKQWLATSWGPVTDVGSQGFPFHLYGTAHISALQCNDIFFFNAKCNANGAAQAMVKLSGDWSGETIGFDLDGDDYISPIMSNGTNSIAKLTVPHAGMGAHTVTLEDPAGCYAPVNFNCQVDAPADPEWDALWAEYDALEATTLKTLPAETRIIGNYPNPFNPSTTIRYTLSNDGPVSIRVYNMLGQEVAALVDGFQKAGEQSVKWNGTNNFGQAVASGLYIYRLQTGSTVMSQKMLFTK